MPTPLGRRSESLSTCLECEPASPSEADRISARQFDGELSRWFLDPIYRGRYPKDVIEYHEREGRLPDGMSFVKARRSRGRFTLRSTSWASITTAAPWCGAPRFPKRRTNRRTIAVPDPAELTDMGWEVHPDGLTEVLVRLNADYEPGSLVVTENGAAYGTGPGPDGSVEDALRCEYLRSHLRACLAAIDAGVPLARLFSLVAAR